jgi:uncharacterized protein RhaS with RHS repeats
MKRMFIIVLFISFVSSALGYYSPEQGRWQTRDPIGEAGGIALYAFVVNNPVGWFDSNGLKGQDATIQCNGGKYEIVLNAHKGKPNEECVRKHEEQHIKDWKDRYGENSCQGVPDGELPKGGDNYEKFLHGSECKAYAISRDCDKELARTCPDADDRAYIQGEASRANNILGAKKCPQYIKDFSIFN